MNPIKARNYGQAETCLANREPFDHSTMSARWEGGIYRVRSYWTEVATYDPDTGESWVSENYWGQTTGRHLGYCRRNLPRVRSNDPSALDGVGPGAKVEYDRPGAAGDGPTRVYGYCRETYPLANRVVIEPLYGYGAAREVLPRESVVLA